MGGRAQLIFIFFVSKKQKKRHVNFLSNSIHIINPSNTPPARKTFLPLGNNELTQVYFTVWRKKKMSYEPKNILITGGAGFIASHVAILFAKKYPHCKVSLCIV